MKWKSGALILIFFLTFASSQDAISQWSTVKSPLYVHCLYVDGATVYAGAIDSGAVWYSSDNGATWKNKPSVSAHDGVSAITRSDKYLFAGTFSTGIWRSENNGETWSNVSTGLPSGQSINCLAVNGPNIFATTAYKGVFRSTDYGANWNSVLSKETNISSSSSLAFSGNTLFVATRIGLFRTTDNGDSWQLVLDSLATGVGVLDSTVFCSAYFGMSRSTNNGLDWVLDTNRSRHGMSLFYIYGHDIFTSGGGGETTNIYLSKNTGLSWADLGQVHRIGSLCVSGPNLIAGSTNTGIWYRPISGILNEVKETTEPDIDITLSPNPTTGIITVHNAPANIIHVTVNSILGESVLELEHPNAPDFTLDLSKLQQGTYFAKFALAGSVITRKIEKQ